MSDLPLWLQLLQGLLTPTIALAVAWIAFQQWRTSRAKLNLDLFEKRYEVYQNAYGALTFVVSKGGSLDTPAFGRMFEAWRESQFLFGAEVPQHLDSLLLLIMELQATESELKDETPEHAALVAKKWDRVRKLSAARSDLQNFFKPYMLMDDKRVGTLIEWFEERNRMRLSYADEKQK